MYDLTIDISCSRKKQLDILLDLGLVKVRNILIFRIRELEGCPKYKVEASRRLSSSQFNQNKQLSETNFGLNFSNYLEKNRL